MFHDRFVYVVMIALFWLAALSDMIDVQVNFQFSDLHMNKLDKISRV